jgi:hypothetical protein
MCIPGTIIWYGGEFQRVDVQDFCLDVIRRNHISGWAGLREGLSSTNNAVSKSIVSGGYFIKFLVVRE